MGIQDRERVPAAPNDGLGKLECSLFMFSQNPTEEIASSLDCTGLSVLHPAADTAATAAAAPAELLDVFSPRLAAVTSSCTCTSASSSRVNTPEHRGLLSGDILLRDTSKSTFRWLTKGPTGPPVLSSKPAPRREECLWVLTEAEAAL